MRKMGTLIVTAAALAASLTACGGEKTYSSVAEKAKETKKLVIGVKYDQPGLGLKKPDGSVEGFDVDVAKYVAGELGVPASGITWKETRSANREPFIQQGQVDLVFATYSITDDRRKKVTFGGPYYVAHQDILVRADDSSITKVEDLAGKKVCSVTGSVSAKRITEEKGIKAQLQEVGGYAECVTRLLGGQLDAVTTDNTILAGFAAQNPGKLKLLGANLSDEKYGVGMKLGDKTTCEAVNKALDKFFSSGAAKQAMEKNFGPANFQFDPNKPTYVGCA